ncbi:hypothetical protein [Mycolicibacterium aichiense]|uniref:Uncharacterized protein n=1 Tax=Mycolicibacterium aichiense TaxID=1799 RepID=A0AAD1HLZ3_9MYCO|nr:hypothetical protein [Mycolicibacterium aichiense]MCV7019920.1 hypothetical protein [Mycolicibacterium aichiense]BBX07511.1 hypothetical protein MAIC_23140 [Mycolicibacterium aichiense]STZ81325.1 Uncharacterised protein [Mycolicibacterium aichiense]
MRNAVIVAAAGCVMFLVALISGSVWAAAGVIVLALAGLGLVAADLRREQNSEESPDVVPTLVPENFAPDITDDDAGDVTKPDPEGDEYGDYDFPYDCPFDFPFGGLLPAPADDDTRIA